MVHPGSVGRHGSISSDMVDSKVSEVLGSDNSDAGMAFRVERPIYRSERRNNVLFCRRCMVSH